MCKKLVWLATVVLLGLSCGQEPGSFTMSFSWKKAPDGQVWVWVRVEERADGTQSGPILASAGPETYIYGDSVTVAMNDVANGKNRYIIAEVRDGANPNLPIMYYGISEPFDLAPGMHNHIKIPMELQIPEAQSVTASISLEFDGKLMDQVGLNEIHVATIMTRSVRAKSIVLANDASFSVNQTQVDLVTGGKMECGTEEKGDMTWDVCSYNVWDLAPDRLDEDLFDQEYTLFAKFVDQYGYESQVYRTSVILDSQGPQALLGSLTPDVAYPGAAVYLSISFHETAIQDSLTLTVVPQLPPDSSIGPPERVGSSNTYVWELSLSSDWPQDKETLAFLVSTEDALGNKWPDQQVMNPDKNPLSLLIDPQPPILVEGVGEGFSQSLFGLPDAGTVLTFSFAIQEANPHAMTAGADDICQGICPVVKIGSAALGTVRRDISLDATADNQLGFYFDYPVDDADFIKKDSEPLVSVTWTDRAGNGLEAVITGDLHLDFQPPDVLSCSLVPEFGNATSLFTYTVTASESLLDAPLLKVNADTQGLFDAAPEMSDSGQTWEWQQPASGLPSQDITVSALLTDNAGNTSAGYLCPQTSAVDGEPPLLVLDAGLQPSLWTIPEVLNTKGTPTLACGDGYELRVSFTVTEAKGIAEDYPDVRLAVPGKEIPLTQLSTEETGDNQLTFEYSVVLTTAKHADSEGSWPVRVTLQDNSANETVIDKLADAFVKLDFTPPEAECSLIPANTAVGYPIGQKVMVQIAALEELPNSFVPAFTESFNPPFEPPLAVEFFTFEKGTKYRFARTILDTDGERSFEVAVSLTDIVGNSTAPGMTACNNNTSITGTLDGAAPTVESVAIVVDDGDIDAAVTPLKKGREVAVTVQTTGSLSSPVLSLGKSAIPQTAPDPVIIQEGLLEWTFARTLDGTEGEGIQYVRATIQDESGNEVTYLAEDLPLTLDFNPPVAQCKLFPHAAKVGDTVTVSINTSEPLQGGLPVFTSGDEGFKFTPPDSGEATTSFEYTHFISEADALLTIWSYEVSLTDLAGNSTDGPVCSGGGTIDADPPTVVDEQVSVWTEPEVMDPDGSIILAVGPGDMLLVTFTIAEAQAVPADGLAVMVDIPGAPVYLENSGLEAVEEGHWSASFELIFEPDDVDDPTEIEGLWPLKAQVEDEAGNVTLVEGLGGELVRIDFTPPEAECSLIPTPGEKPYGIGKKILVQAAALETLSPVAEFAPVLHQEWDPAFADPEFKFFVLEQKLRFAGTVKEGDDERSFETGFRLTDLVGNQTPQGQTACIGGLLTGAIDGLRPEVQEVIIVVQDGTVDHTNTPLKTGLSVTTQLTIENTSLKPTVTLGSGSLETQSEGPLELGDDLFMWHFQRTLDGSEGEGTQFIAVNGYDEAGNSYSHIAQTSPMELDYTGPKALCTVMPALAKLADSVTLLVEFSEALEGTGIPSADADVNLTAPGAIQTPGTAEYTWMVGPQHAELTQWNFTVNLTDLAGNPSDGPACTGSGLVDAVSPALSDQSVATDPTIENSAGQTVLVGGDGSVIKAGFRVTETQGIGADYPQVVLNVPGNPLPFVQTGVTDNQDGTLDYQYELTVSAVNHLEAEGKWPIQVVVEDVAGNHIEEPKFASDTRVQLDFTPPGAECSLIPNSPDFGYPTGQKVLLQVFPHEELLLGSTPELIEEMLPDPGEALFQYSENTSYSFTHIVDATHGNLDFTVRVTMTDLVGNNTPEMGNACSGGELTGSTDTVPPAMSAPELKTIPEVTDSKDIVVLAAGPGDQVVTSFDITEHENLDIDEITVNLSVAGGAVPFDTVAVEQVEPHLFHVNSILTMDQFMHADAEGAWPVSITMSDSSGNVNTIPALTGKLVTIDFTPPAATCSLIPTSSDENRLAIGQNAMLQVNPVEEIQGPPDLLETFIPSWNGQFFTYEEDSSWRWNHVVSESDGEHSLMVMVAMTDLVGNTTEQNQTACTTGVLSGFFDGIRPTVADIDISLDPPGDDPLTTPLKSGRKIIAAFDTSNQSLQPSVFLGAGTMTMVGDADLGNGVTRWTFQRTLDGSEGHGAQIISVSGHDQAGNAFAYDDVAQPLTLDFTTPAAQCSIFPAAAKLNDTIVFTVNVSETLAGNTLSITGNLPFGNPLVSPDGLVFTYEYQVTDPTIGIASWSFGIQVCDNAGNCGTGAPTCSGTVAVDAEVPSVINPINVTTNPVITDSSGETIKVVRHGGVISASFSVSELKGLADDSPSVWLNASGTWVAMTKSVLNHDPENGLYEALYTLTVDENEHSALEGLWPIRVALEDSTGNIGVTDNLGGADNRVSLDFTPPQAFCSLVPELLEATAYGIGETVSLSISSLEELNTAENAPLVETTLIPGGGTFDLESTVCSTSTTCLASDEVDSQAAERSFSSRVVLTDLVGNQTAPGGTACLEGVLSATIDGTQPVVQSLSLTTPAPEYDDDGPLKAGVLVHVTAAIQGTTQEPTVHLGNGQMSPAVGSPTGPLPAGVWTWVFERTLDGTEGEGQLTVTVVGQDGAGNAYDEGALVASTVLDITPPTAVCMLAPELAKKGDTVQLVVTTSEALLDSNALPAVVADIALEAPLPEPGETVFTFTHVVEDGATDVPEWTYQVTLVDRAGNASVEPWACSDSGSIDATPPAIAGGSEGITVSHEYLKDGTVLTVSFNMADAGDKLDSPPLVTVGEIELDAAAAPPGVDYKYTHMADENQDEEGLFALAISIQDLAGNQQFYSPQTVTFDFAEPYLVEDAEVTLTAPSGCPLSSVTAVTWGSTIDVSLTVDNLVAGTPVLRLGNASSGAMFTALDPESDYRTSFNYQLSGITYQQLGNTSGTTKTLYLTVTDKAGNSIALAVGEVLADTSSPARPDVRTGERIVYHRIPWGSQATGGSALFALQGQTGAVEANAWVAAHASDVFSASNLLGVVQAEADGSFGAAPGEAGEFALTTLDRPSVYVLVCDRACNKGLYSGKALEVNYVHWVATMGGKEAGDDFGNPHAFYSRSFDSGRFVQDDDTELDGTKLALADTQYASQVGGGDWVQREFGTDHPVSDLNGPAMAYDSFRDMMVQFGGWASSPEDITWEFDGANWWERIPLDPEDDGNPDSRENHIMVYDSLRQRTVMFSDDWGDRDMWEWDGKSWALVEASNTDDFNPYPRDAAAAFDSERGLTVGFGGNYSDNTYEWDGREWWLRSPTDPEGDGNPTGRSGHGMAYDSWRNRTVLFSGSKAQNTKVDDTWVWEWDGASWKKIIPADPEGDGNPPGSTFSNDIAFDSERGVTVLPLRFSSCPMGVWEWNGISWKKHVAPPSSCGTQPCSISNFAVAYDSRRALTVVLGGTNTAESVAAWAWNGTSWSCYGPDPEGDGSLPAIQGTGQTYNPDLQSVMVFGGVDWDNSKYPTQKLWSYNGDTWKLLSATGGPSYRKYPSMAYESTEHRLLLFGGDHYYSGTDEYYQWTEAGGWAALSQVSPFPSARYHAMMVYDEAEDLTVLLGGQTEDYSGYFNDFWNYDSTSWTQVSTSLSSLGGPAKCGRWYSSATYDKAREVVALSDTTNHWEWNGTTWSKISSSPPDPEGDGNPSGGPGQLFYDSAREVIRTYTKAWKDSVYGWQLWEWNGTSWLHIPIDDVEGDGSPVSLDWGYRTAYDDRRQRALMWGIEMTPAPFWELSFNEEGRPAHVMDASFGATGEWGNAAMLSLRARWRAGGVGNDEATGIDGTQLRIRDRNYWRVVDSNENTLTSPGELAWSTSDPVLLTSDGTGLARGSDGSIMLSTTPAKPNGRNLAQISTDYVELAVDYQLGDGLAWGFDTPDSTEGWRWDGDESIDAAVDGVLTVPYPATARSLVSQFINQFITQVYRSVHLRWRTTCSQPVTIWMKRENKATFAADTAVQLSPVADGEWHVSVSSLSAWKWYGYMDYLGLQLPAGCEGKSIDIDWLRLSSIYAP